MDVEEAIGKLQDDLTDLVKKAESDAIEEGYQQGMNDAARLLREYLAQIKTNTDIDQAYFDGLDDAIATLEQNGAR